VVALLYPFTWQHTLISIVPSILIDVVMAPTPYLLGVQKKMVDLIDDKCDVSFSRRRRNSPESCFSCRNLFCMKSSVWQMLRTKET
jgi:hypothetical protein